MAGNDWDSRAGCFMEDRKLLVAIGAISLIPLANGLAGGSPVAGGDGSQVDGGRESSNGTSSSCRMCPHALKCSKS